MIMGRTQKKKKENLTSNNRRGKEEHGGSSWGSPEKGEKQRLHRKKHETKHTIKEPKEIPVSRLQCQRVKPHESRVLVWKTYERTQTRRASEEAVLPWLYRGKEEFGLSRHFSNSRKEKIRKACYQAGIPLLQALSLRRSYMRKANRGRSMPDMGLGSYKNIQSAASLFEDALVDFLRRRRIPFYSEKEQRDYSRVQSNGRGKTPPTPDVLLRQEIRIRKQHDTSWKEHCVCWMDAKMFYGASSIETDDYSTVGRLMETARKYVSLFGPGAFVFFYGCGYELAQTLLAEGVLALDCSEEFSLDAVLDHQRTWCADRKMNIWP